MTMAKTSTRTKEMDAAARLWGKGEGACVSDDFRVTGIMMFSSRDPMHAGVVE
jgi:hypothetical protein